MPPGQWDPNDDGNNDQQLCDWRTDKLKGCIVLHHKTGRGGGEWVAKKNKCITNPPTSEILLFNVHFYNSTTNIFHLKNRKENTSSLL